MRTAMEGLRSPVHRYLVQQFHFDSTAMLLEPPNSGWDQAVLALNVKNQRRIAVDLSIQYGVQNYDQKLDDFIDFGRIPFAVVGQYTKLLYASRTAFVSGAYFPALATCTTLGELILNVLLEKLSPHFSEHYRRTQNWERMIDKLTEWKALTESLGRDFMALKKLRNKAVHFIDWNAEGLRQDALAAIRLIVSVITELFGVDGGRPWMLKGTPGGMFVAKAFETDPFVLEFILPNSVRVGPFHRFYTSDQGLALIDREYDVGEVSDEGFAELYALRSEENMPPDPTRTSG